MAFNKEKFIAEAKAAGYSDDEINAELGGSTTSAKAESPVKVDMPNGVAGALEPPAMAQAAPSPAAQPAPEKKVIATKQPTTETKQEQPLIPDWLKFPAAVGAGGAAVAGAVTGWKTLRDKMNNSAPDAVERREPTMFGAQRLDEPAWSASTARTPSLSQEEMMNRLRGLADETSAVNEPAFGAFAPAATKEATTAAPSRNLTLEEAQARMAGITPAATPVTPEAAPAKAPWVPPTAEVINKPSMLPSGSTLAPSAAVSPEGAPVNPVEPNAEEAAAAKAAEEKKAKMPLFSDADKKAFTSEQRSVLQHMQYGQTPEEAKNLLRHFENTLPEGVKLSYGTYPEDVYNEAGKKIKTAGTSKGGFPEPKQNLLNFWNEALGTSHALNEKGNFDYKPTPEDVTKAHAYWSEKMANATTPAAKSIAEKGYASLGALAKLAGISLGALGAMHAYKTGKETGDWSDLGLLGGSLLAGASVPAQIAYQGLTYSKPLGETQEQLKQLGKQLEYAGKVGYGRGLVNPPNAIPPPRHTMTNR